ncbi:MAG: DUF2061 domain-containing protein [Cyclobacteriaceae bacterium]
MLTKRRHLAKTITWRIVASLTTFLLTVFFFKDDPNATQKAANVALIEAALKMILYYYHERVWFRIKLAIRSTIRHLLKAVTWRLIASITTFAIAFVMFRSDPMAVEKASGVAIAETFLKMLLYYLHERVWYKQNLGLESREKNIDKLASKIEEE